MFSHMGWGETSFLMMLAARVAPKKPDELNCAFYVGIGGLIACALGYPRGELVSKFQIYQ